MNPTSNFSSTTPGYTTSNPNTTYSSSAHPVTTGHADTALPPKYADTNPPPPPAQQRPVPNPPPTSSSTTTNPSTTTATADATLAPDGTSRIGQPTKAGHSAVSGIKGVFAGIHGAGEAIRGTFNSAVDELAGDRTGKTKNDNVTVGGIDEMESGEFTRGTKEREGVVPGDKGRRF